MASNLTKLFQRIVKIQQWRPVFAKWEKIPLFSRESAFSGCSQKCSPLQERGMATNSRLQGEGVALYIDLETGVTHKKHYFYSMPARTRGGLWRNTDWRSERVFTTPTGVKICRVNGRHQYNPPTLKFSCVRVLDYNFPYQTNPKLYTHVQACVDKLVDLVEAHLNGTEWGGTITT